jgi:putative colanic acid biosynthesis acetyltransferase WcaF
LRGSRGGSCRGRSFDTRRGRCTGGGGSCCGCTAHVYPTARIWAPWNLTLCEHACAGDLTDLYCVAPVTIGPRSTVSHYSFLCAASHDFEHPDHPLTTAPITLGANVWLAADVFVAPGVSIADGVVVGARSSVFGDLEEPWTLYAGSPARPIRKRVMRDSGRT